MPMASTSSYTNSAKAGARKRTARGRSPRTESTTPSPFTPRDHREAVLYRLIRDPNVAVVLRALIDQMYKSKVLPDQFQSHLSSLLGTFGQPATPQSTSTDLPRPAKRRRMDRIPAGAEDWIVPYPFQPDEAPEHFQEMRDIHILDSVLKSLERNVKSWKNARGVLNEPTRPRNSPLRNTLSPVSLSTPLDNAAMLNGDWLNQQSDDLLLALDQMLGLPATQPMDVETEDPANFASGLLESLGLMLPSVSVSESTASTSRLTTPVDAEFGMDLSMFDGMDWSALEGPAGPKELESLPSDLNLLLDSFGSTIDTSVAASPISMTASRGTTPMLDSRPNGRVPALSKRGRGRSVAVLRRQFNRRAPTSSPAPSTAPVGAETPSARGTRKTRANQETTKKREETLVRAREHREALALELDRARMERWEVLMEGVVLRESAILMTQAAGAPHPHDIGN